MQGIEKKYFASPDGALDSDSADFAINPNSWVNMENCRSLTTDGGRTMRVESIGGTKTIFQPEPLNNYIYLGGAEEPERNRFCWFLFDKTGSNHRIMCYDRNSGSVYTVLLSSQTTEGLKFDKYYPIHSARIVSGLLYWTDYLNQPRRINIDAGINLNHPGTIQGVEPYTSPLDENIITVIRKPPNLPPEVVKVEQTSPAIPANHLVSFAGKFSVYYKFRDGEFSTLSPYSQLINYNFKADKYNSVDVSLRLDDKIPQDVVEIRFAVQYGVDPNFFVVKTFDIYNDAAAISAHNAGTSALSFRFYNDRIGIPIGNDLSTKPNDSVPIVSEGLEVAKNRLYLANNIEGYDAPNTTSLTASFVSQSSGTSLQGSVFKLTWGGGANNRYVIHIPSITGGNPSGYYRVTADDTTPPASTVDQSLLTFISSGTTEVFQYYVPGWPTDPIDSFTFQNYVTVSGVSNPLINQIAYKSGASYIIGVVFYDRWMRKCGVVTDGKIYTTPERTYSMSSYTTSLDWVLTNNASEIPEYAHFYSIVRTRCISVLSFIQARSKNPSVASMSYVDKNQTTGEYIIGNISSYSPNLAGIAVNISNIWAYGLGYVFEQGDILKLYLSTGSGQPYYLRVIGQQGQWVIVELSDVGDLTVNTDALFEIYTPYTPSLNEPYFEVGQVYPISNPGTAQRGYTVLGGSIRGDITLIQRGLSPNNYITENMSPNDTYWKEWLTDAGRPNFIDTIGRKAKKSNISYSNVLIPGTKTNGLSSFDALDEKNLPVELGAIRKIQIASKVQDEQGIIMLAICERGTASLYLGEVQTYQSNSSSNVVISEQTIGTINVLKGGFGTINPESVTEYRGRVYWYDANNGRVIQYSSNGLFPVSDYRARRFWKQFSDLYKSKSKSEIEALGSRPFISMVVDPYHEELLISIPKLLNDPPSGYLPDYPSIAYPFDIWDGRTKTMVFKIDVDGGNPHWQGAYTFYSEGFVSLANELYSFNNGNLYLHNQTTNYNQFFGVQNKSRIMFVSNKDPNVPKIYHGISIEGNLAPTLTYLYADTPYQQASDLLDYNYNNLEGVLYATILRNKLIPTVYGYDTGGIISGDRIRAYSLYVMLEFSPYLNTPLRLKFVNLRYSISRGHKTI